MNRSVKTVALIVCLVLLATAALFLFGGKLGTSYADADKYTAGDAEITSPVENLEVNWTSGSVNLVYHSGSSITVSETAGRGLADNDRLRWWLDGTTLKIQFCSPGFRLFRNLQKTLTVSLPEGMKLKSATINGTSADLNIPSLSADDVVLHTTSGNIAASAEAKNLAVTATSGSIDLHQAGFAEAVSLSVTSGDISAALDSAGSVEAGTTSGDIGLTLTGSVKTLLLHSTSGNITSSAAETEKAECASTSGSINARFSAVSELKLGSTSGNVTASLPENPGFTCKVKTTSGTFSSALELRKDGDTYLCGDGSGRYSISTTSGNVRIEKDGN